MAYCRIQDHRSRCLGWPQAGDLVVIDKIDLFPHHGVLPGEDTVVGILIGPIPTWAQNEGIDKLSVMVKGQIKWVDRHLLRRPRV